MGTSCAGIDADPRRVIAHQVKNLSRGKRAFFPGGLEQRRFPAFTVP
jgi:hypothetical protein